MNRLIAPCSILALLLLTCTSAWAQDDAATPTPPEQAPERSQAPQEPEDASSSQEAEPEGVEEDEETAQEPVEPAPALDQVVPAQPQAPVVAPAPKASQPVQPAVPDTTAPAPQQTTATNTPKADAADALSMQTQFGSIQSLFTFGSYARVRAASDLDGGTARPVNVVTNGSRIDEYSYAELEFAQRFQIPNADNTFFAQAVATLAFGRDFFHFTGVFDQSIAMRNLYGEAGWKLMDDALTVSFWGGSRMYRGDDIYLLDFWPLDNLNTVGGGAAASYDWKGFGRTALKLHAGANRLLNDYQYQVIEVPGLEVGADQVVFLDRQRFISSYRLQQDIWLDTDAQDNPTMGLKIVLYGEDHRLDQGTRRSPDGLSTEVLPAEGGTKLGGELGYWIGDGALKGTFVNLFYTYGSDLAAYGEFGIPSGVNDAETSEGASLHQVALSADLETPYMGLLVGAYYKYFQDADDQSIDDDDYWESIIAARAHGYVTRHIHPGVEFSYQVRKPEGPNPGTNQYEVPTVTKLSLIQAISLDKGMYSRPQLRLIYSHSWLNASAQNLYRPEDPRSQMSSQQYFGVMVEWWFNNASLFRP